MEILPVEKSSDIVYNGENIQRDISLMNSSKASHTSYMQFYVGEKRCNRKNSTFRINHLISFFIC